MSEKEKTIIGWSALKGNGGVIVGSCCLLLLCVQTFAYFGQTRHYFYTTNDTKENFNVYKYKYTPVMDGIVVPKVNHTRNITVLHHTSKDRVCVVFAGRLGNQMFEFASSLGIAAEHNMSLWVSNKGLLKNAFDMPGVSFVDEGFIKRRCKERWEGRNIKVFHKDLLKFPPGNNYLFTRFLQSWKYFYDVTVPLRQLFTFKTPILVEKNKTISLILKKYNLKRSDATFVGVHVRRGDYVYERTERVATRRYLEKAVKYFLSREFPNTIFVTCSNDMKWTRKNMPRGINVEFITGNTPEVDLAILGSCDHMLSTSGTYSWWAGWLTGGEVTYYQWPALQGAPLLKPFPLDHLDYFYPGWIGFTGI